MYMFSGLSSGLSDIARLSNAKTRSISPENFTGEKGKGGMATEGTGMHAARDLGQGWKVSPSINIKAGETFVLADIQGSGAIKHIWITDNMPRPRLGILRMYWDDSEVPSVEVPLGDFFATADQQNYAQISSLAVCVNPKRGLNCYWEMPFRKRAKITLENISDRDYNVYYQIDYVETEIPEDAAYFHAQFRRTNPLPYATPYTIVDNIKGKGQYVGTYMYWGVNNNGWWGEGEIKFFMDGDTDFPTICGTGTEDYFCGAYNFDVDGQYTTFTTPYAGLAKLSNTDQTYMSQRRFSMYRWHIVDPIYFDTDLRVTIQALGWRSGGRYLPLMDDISSVAYWYQSEPAKEMPPLPSADELEII
jgi:hypothetical protein